MSGYNRRGLLEAVEPTGKRHYLALDVSGSMQVNCSGSQVLSCKVASAAMALVTAAVEPSTHIVGFTGVGRYGQDGTELTALPITGQTRLDDAISTVSRLPFGRTDCALPMLDALERGDGHASDPVSELHLSEARDRAHASDGLGEREAPSVEVFKELVTQRLALGFALLLHGRGICCYKHNHYQHGVEVEYAIASRLFSR